MFRNFEMAKDVNGVLMELTSVSVGCVINNELERICYKAVVT
jgi:hypothetical protein